MDDSQADTFRKVVKWEELAPLPVNRTMHNAVLLGGVVYVGGGFEGRSVYDDQYLTCLIYLRLSYFNAT